MAKKSWFILVAIPIMYLLIVGMGHERMGHGGMGHGGIVWKAGKIRIIDQVMEKYDSPSNPLLMIDLNDIAKLAGHLCGGSTSGFMMTKLALKSLYGKFEIPLRGDIKLTSNSESEPARIAAYIVGASDEVHHGVAPTWTIDESIGTVQGSVALVFERMSTGKIVKLEWDKVGTLTEHTGGNLAWFKQIKLRTIHGCASDDEVAEFQGLLKSFVVKVVNGDIDYGLEILDWGTWPPIDMRNCHSCHSFCPAP